ncbi:unnamed protein product, partial [Allacma fusca]
MSDSSKTRNKRKQDLVVRSVPVNMKVHRKSRTSTASKSSKKTDMSVSDASSPLPSTSNASPIESNGSSSTRQRTIDQFLHASGKRTKNEIESSEQFARNEIVDSFDSSSDVEDLMREVTGIEDRNDFDKSGESDTISGSGVNSVGPNRSIKLEKLPCFQIPSWLQKYFKYEGHLKGSKNKRNTAQMTCRICSSDPNFENKSGTVQGTPFFNFKRHIKVVHPGEYAKEDPEITGDAHNKLPKVNVGISNAETFFESVDWIKPNNKDTYSMTHPVQSRFVKDMVDCVAIDSVPLDLIERPTFIKMVRNLNKNIRLFSRRTIGRRLKLFYTQEFKQKMKSVLNQLVAKSLHLILDLWTDRQKNSVIGFKAQFIDTDWKMKNTVLAFRHFTSHHTSIEIRKIFDEVLRDTYKINAEKVGFVVGDNASNVKAAFDCVASVPNSVIETMDYEEKQDIDNTSQEAYEILQRELNAWTNMSLTKLPCYCHMLQLIIKDALGANSVISALIKDVKKVKNYFHSSPYWYNQFKSLAGKGLVNQADTRWNTVSFVFDRLKEPRVRDALDTILGRTRATSNPCKVSFSTGDYLKMEMVSNLLTPIQDLTNYLQADGVTSSLVIPGISGAYKAIQDMAVGTDTDVHDFQGKLLRCLQERFSSNYVPILTSDQSRLNRITRNEVYTNKNLVLATMLDPRFKTAPFKDTADEFNCGKTSSLGAVKILEDQLHRHKQKIKNFADQFNAPSKGPD